MENDQNFSEICEFESHRLLAYSGKLLFYFIK